MTPKGNGISRFKYFMLFLFGMGGFITLISLGIWQMERLDEKRAMIADIAQKQRADYQALSLPSPLPDMKDDYYQEILFKKAYFEGKFIAGKSLYYYGQNSGSAEIGYKIMHLFQTSQGFYIPVIIGFSPLKDAKMIANPLPQLESISKVKGVLLPHFDKKQFTPDNNIANNEYYWDDMIAFAQHYDINAQQILPLRLYAHMNLGLKNVMPDLTLPNSHKQYMLTWFTLAFFWAIQSIYLYMRERKKHVSIKGK